MFSKRGTKSSRFNWKQRRFRSDMRTNHPTIIKDKPRSRLRMWAWVPQPLEVFNNLRYVKAEVELSSKASFLKVKQIWYLEEALRNHLTQQY